MKKTRKLLLDGLKGLFSYIYNALAS
ncbi:uncharacterized protein METZ01_LOCUS368357 [marine metagenome]|uniref:Uncharacterized protein n=1 Tax=marine metagenome TaxID=408172 RepID=A0A382T0J8_9ZZZZ